MRIAVKFAYDGRKFYGYARQLGLKTVEGEIIKTLIQHGFIEDAKKSRFRSASRTDKGVSALGNVVAFNTDFTRADILQKLNEDLTDIIVYGTACVDAEFYPRYAKQRSYRYYLKKNSLDVEKVFPVASYFIGKHNFSNFARVEEFKDPIRIIDNVVVNEQNDFLIVDFYAQTFLWHQIRRIISAVEKVGRGKLEEERIIEALCSPDKKVDFGLASAEPLILKDIVYDFDFEYDKNYLKTLNDLENRIAESLSN